MAVEAAVVRQRLIDRVRECFVGRETTPIEYDATALPRLRRSAQRTDLKSTVVTTTGRIFVSNQCRRVA
jgi:hypothetical protein